MRLFRERVPGWEEHCACGMGGSLVLLAGAALGAVALWRWNPSVARTAPGCV